MSLCSFPGCGKALDNSGFIPEFVYDGSGEDIGNEQPGETVPDNVPVDQVKVISFNVRVGTGDKNTKNAWDLRKKAIGPLLTKENPTVFGVQEAIKEQMDYMKQVLPDYDAVGVGRDDGVEKGEHMSIFWKRDVVIMEKSGTFWLSQTPDVPSKGWDANYYRTATWAIFKVKATGENIVWVDPNAGVKAILADKGMIFEGIQNNYEVRPITNPAGLYTNYWASAPGNFIGWDPIYNFIVFKTGEVA